MKKYHQSFLSITYVKDDFFVKNDIASLSKNIIQISVSLSESIFGPALQIITRVIILIFISILLININVFAFIGSLSLLD